MGTILVVDIKMKTAILVLFISLTIFSIAESCINPCNGVTAATCTSPCYQCGGCRQYCCKTVVPTLVIGRNEEDRTFRQFCAPGEGREMDESEEMFTEDPVTLDETEEFEEIKILEEEAFVVCDFDKDGGLSWDEVEKCEDMYGKLLNLDHLPNKNDFDHYDTNSNGVLLFEEWEGSNNATDNL